MQVTEIKMTMSFGKFENVTMTARLKEGDDPLKALFQLEQLMSAGIARHEAEAHHGASRCRVCGCTDESACEGGCSWVDDDLIPGDLCSACEPEVLAERLRSELIRCRVLEIKGWCTEAYLDVIDSGNRALMSMDPGRMRDALILLELVGTVREGADAQGAIERTV